MDREKCREKRRWLLPFTTGVSISSIALALRQADLGDATLVAVSFIATPDGRNVRLEHIQQSRDFLEAIRHKAHRLSISVECHEVFTGDILASIATQVHDLACESLILACEGERALFLQQKEMQQIALSPPASLVLLRSAPAATAGSRSGLRNSLLSWVQQRARHQKTLPPFRPSPLVLVRGGTSAELVNVRGQKEA